jgi:hypothetical protein
MMEIEEKASLWLQAREATPEKQQPTANERLLAASALPVAASKRSNTREATTYNQWMAVGCKRFACGCKQEKQHQRGNNLQPMNGCWLQALCLWLQAREATPERQQPTANERLLAARARAPHEAERQQPTANERLLAASALPVAASKKSKTREATTYSQWTAVGCKRFACGCKQEKQHQRGNNLQPMSGCWLQARARAPHEAERHWGTNERLLMMEIEEKASLWLQAREATPERQQPTANERLLAASALPVAASKRSNTREATTYSQWAAVGCKSKSTSWGRETLKHQWAAVGWSQQATPERQQPTANEWLLAASALPMAASKRSNTREATTYSQWAAVGCKSKSTTWGRETLRHQWAVVGWSQQATPERQQPTANERLLAARARAPHEAERHWGTNERLLMIESKLLDKATATMGQ